MSEGRVLTRTGKRTGRCAAQRLVRGWGEERNAIWVQTRGTGHGSEALTKAHHAIQCSTASQPAASTLHCLENDDSQQPSCCEGHSPR